MPLSLKGHIIKNAYHRKSPLVPDNSVNLGLTKGNDTTAGEWNSPPLATDPWINESTHQAGDCTGRRWWKISKCCSIRPGVKLFSLPATLLFFITFLGLRWKVFLFLFLHNHPSISVNSSTCLRTVVDFITLLGSGLWTLLLSWKERNICISKSIFQGLFK